MAAIYKFSRRDFFKVTAATGAGLILGAHLPGCADEKKGAGVFVPSVFLSIDPDGTATVYVPRTEMGQGVRTSLPMLVAEELDADWADVRCEGVPADEQYGDMKTSGSTSIRDFYNTLLNVGATARTMLVSAAATFPILMGSIDLSVAANTTLTGIVAALFIPRIGVYAAIPALLVGVGFGLLNGMVSVRLKLPSFIITLGTMSIMNGTGLLLSGGSPIWFQNDAFTWISKGTILGGLQNIVVWSVLAYVLFSY